MAIRFIGSAAAVVIGTLAIGACVGDDPGTNPSTPVDAGSTPDGATPPNDSGGPDGEDGGPPPDSGNDSGGGTFCTKHPGAALCEDFEDPEFPPGGWITENTGASLEPALGYQSTRALAAFKDATTSAVDAVLYRDDVVLTAAHQHLKLEVRVRATTFADSKYTTALYLRLTPTVFITYAITSPTTAAVVVDPDTVVQTTFSLAAWHHVEVDVELSDPPMMTVRYDDAAVGAAVAIPAFAVGPKRVAAGLQTDVNTAARRIEVDDILVDLTQ